MFIAFLKFRDQPHRWLILDRSQLAAQFTEFADEELLSDDRELAPRAGSPARGANQNQTYSTSP